MTTRGFIEWCCRLGLIAILAALVLGRLSFLVPYLDWLSHFPVYYLLASAAITVLLVLIARWASACFGLIVVLICLVLLAGPFLHRRGHPINPSDANLVVAVANISIRNPLREEVAASLPEADVMALLETEHAWTETLDGLKSRWPWQWRELRDNPFGMSVLSKHPITASDWIMLTPGDAPALHLTLSVNGAVVEVLVIHTMSPQSPRMLLTRDAQFKELTSRVNSMSENVIVMGDFNASNWTSSMQTMMDLTGLRNSRAGSGLRGSVLGTWPSRAPALLRIPIDHCLIRGAIDPVGNETFRLNGSDHHGLLVDLVVESP